MNILKSSAGTGRYTNKIGTFEEGGNTNSELIYAKLLKNGENYLCIDPKSDPEYAPREGELAEICCPIKMDNRIIGLIGLVAFNAEQREKIIANSSTLTLFLVRMAELLASKLSETEQRNQLQGIVESMHEGLIAIDKDFIIKSCNYESEKLLGLKRDQMEGRLLSEIWEIKEVERVVKGGISTKDKEVIFRNKNDQEKRFLCTFIPLNPRNSEYHNSSALGAMILFQNMSRSQRKNVSNDC